MFCMACTETGANSIMARLHCVAQCSPAQYYAENFVLTIVVFTIECRQSTKNTHRVHTQAPSSVSHFEQHNQLVWRIDRM